MFTNFVNILPYSSNLLFGKKYFLSDSLTTHCSDVDSPNITLWESEWVGQEELPDRLTHYI